MSDEHHANEHRKHARFTSRNCITHVGMNCGRECAIEQAKGFLEGCVDELKTLIGEEKALEFVMSTGDKIPMPPGSFVKVIKTSR